MDVATENNLSAVIGQFGLESVRSGFGWNFLGKCMCCMFVQGVLFFAVTLAIRSGFWSLSCNGSKVDSAKDQFKDVEDEDEDVKRERNHVLRLYARLRGLDEHRAKKATEWGLKKLALAAYSDRCTVFRGQQREIVNSNCSDMGTLHLSSWLNRPAGWILAPHSPRCAEKGFKTCLWPGELAVLHGLQQLGQGAGNEGHQWGSVMRSGEASS